MQVVPLNEHLFIITLMIIRKVNLDSDECFSAHSLACLRSLVSNPRMWDTVGLGKFPQSTSEPCKHKYIFCFNYNCKHLMDKIYLWYKFSMLFYITGSAFLDSTCQLKIFWKNTIIGIYLFGIKKKMPWETYKKSVFEKGPILENTLRRVVDGG